MEAARFLNRAHSDWLRSKISVIGLLAQDKLWKKGGGRNDVAMARHTWTLTGVHGTHTPLAPARTHARSQSHDGVRVTRPNQFHSQASCQAAMLDKYYANACVSG